jgi:hypothetical protein
VSFTKALHAIGGRIDDVLEQMTMSVVLVDVDGVIRWQNAASIALVGDRRGLPGVESVAPEYVHEVQAAFRRLRRALGVRSRLEAVVRGRELGLI